MQRTAASISAPHPRDWNASTLVETKRADSRDRKTQMLKVRAGLAGDPILKPGKTNAGEGKLDRSGASKASGTAECTAGEPSPAAVSARGEKPSWNISYSTRTKEDFKQASALHEKNEARRKRMHARDPKLGAHPRDTAPLEAAAMVNGRLRDRKEGHQDLKDQFKRELRIEFPNGSPECLQAMATRLLSEKLAADEKLMREHPGKDAHFAPNIGVTSHSRRYREYHHPGAWTWNTHEKQFCWSCCMDFGLESRGCESKMVNPDAWCLIGYESFGKA